MSKISKLLEASIGDISKDPKLKKELAQAIKDKVNNLDDDDVLSLIKNEKGKYPVKVWASDPDDTNDLQVKVMYSDRTLDVFSVDDEEEMEKELEIVRKAIKDKKPLNLTK